MSRGGYSGCRPAPSACQSSIRSFEPAGVDAVLDQLLPERVAVDPEDLGGAELVPARLAQDGAQERLLHEPDHQVVEVRTRVLAQASYALHQLALDDLFEGGVHRDGGGRGD